MVEYKVEVYYVNRAEAEMNRLAAEGWHLIAVCPNQCNCRGVIVTYVRHK